MRVTQTQAHYDIVVIGGGLVGASFACMIAKRMPEVRILVTEASASVQTSSSFDDRATALSCGSQQLYQNLGLWDALKQYGTAIAHIHVSDRGHFGAVRLHAADLGVAALGHVVENQHLGVVLNAALDAAPTIDYVCPARVSALHPLPLGMQVTLSSAGAEQTPLSAGLVVLADGGKSTLTAELGIAMEVTHYEQTALIANIAFSDPHGHVAYERFTDSGPLAVLPLASFEGENRGALVWTVPSAEASQVLALPDAAFLHALQERFGQRLGQFTRVGTRALYPLSLSVAKEQVRPGLVLLGNVAHSLHPVAGQGLNLALRDAEALSLSLSQARRDGLPLGAMSVLQCYQERQGRDQALTIYFSHNMTRLFSSQHPALVWARKCGLFSIDLVPPLKRGFARQAMGLGGRKQRSA